MITFGIALVAFVAGIYLGGQAKVKAAAGAKVREAEQAVKDEISKVL